MLKAKLKISLESKDATGVPVAPVLMLGAVSVFFTELLSGNIPFPLIAHPLVLVLLVIAYSLPILVIRDVAARWNLGVVSISVLGLAYGIYNEGITAKTLLAANGPTPLPSFTDYAVFGGINCSWAICILIWHASNSVLYPIALVSALWPGKIQQVWFGRKTTAAFLFLSISAGVLAYFKNPPQHPSPVYLAVFSAVIAILVIIARWLRGIALLRYQPSANHIRPFMIGSATIVFYAVIQPMAAARVSFFLYIATAFLVLGVFIDLLRRNDWYLLPSLSRFAVGSYAAGVLIRICGPSKSPFPLEPVLVGAVFAAVLTALVLKIRRVERGRFSEPEPSSSHSAMPDQR